MNLCACVHVCVCEATPIKIVMAHRNFNYTAWSQENSLPVNQSVLFIQGNRFTVNWFIEVASPSCYFFFVK